MTDEVDELNEDLRARAARIDAEALENPDVDPGDILDQGIDELLELRKGAGSSHFHALCVIAESVYEAQTGRPVDDALRGIERVLSPLFPDAFEGVDEPARTDQAMYDEAIAEVARDLSWDPGVLEHHYRRWLALPGPTPPDMTRAMAAACYAVYRLIKLKTALRIAGVSRLRWKARAAVALSEPRAVAVRDLLGAEIKCPACHGSGELESDDSTDERIYRCGRCEGRGRRIFENAYPQAAQLLRDLADAPARPAELLVVRADPAMTLHVPIDESGALIDHVTLQAGDRVTVAPREDAS